jgi:hydrogenase maturation protease
VTAEAANRVVVVGVGNPFRHDDGVGPAVVERLRARRDQPPGVTLAVTDGEPTRLIDLWDGADLAVVVDAVHADPAQPGRVHEFVLGEVPAEAGAASSHGVAVGTVVELAVALGRMPRRLVVLAVEGGDFTVGAGLTPPVVRAVDDVVRRIGAVSPR